MASNFNLTGVMPSLPSLVKNELRRVYLGVKPAARFRLARSALSTVVPALESTGLGVCVGFESVEFSQDVQRSREWASFGSGRYHSKLESFVYVAANAHYAENMRKADEATDHRAMGRLLGYPECCVRCFDEIGLCQTLAANPVFYTYASGAEASWMMNVCLFDAGISLLSHVPCSPNCLGSFIQAREAFVVLFDDDPTEARSMATALCSTTIFMRDGRFVAFIEAIEQDQRVVHRVIRSTLDFAATSHILEGERVVLHQECIQVGPLLLSVNEAKCYRFS